MPAGDTDIVWGENKPYDKTAFLERINKDTPEKKQGLYTLAGYIDGTYGSGKEYLDVAQKNMTNQFVPLWPSMSTQGKHTIIEISKRKPWWELPKTMQESQSLKPSFVVSRDGLTFYTELPGNIDGSKWFDILNKTYPTIEKKLQDYDPLDVSHADTVANIVMLTLQEAWYIKANLGEKAKKTTWGIAGRLKDVFGWLFASKENNN